MTHLLGFIHNSEKTFLWAFCCLNHRNRPYNNIKLNTKLHQVIFKGVTLHSKGLHKHPPICADRRADIVILTYKVKALSLRYKH